MTNHVSAVKKSKECTTGGRSGLHVGMFKANSKVPCLAQLDASMRSLANSTGHSYLHSQTCADVQLCKRSGNINAEEHRTICVSEIDSNTNFKLTMSPKQILTAPVGVLKIVTRPLSCIRKRASLTGVAIVSSRIW